MDASAAHDTVAPRWPVFVRFGHHDEVNIGDIFADDPDEILTSMAGLLRSLADRLEGSVSNP